MPTFEVKTPVGANQIVMKKQIREAVAEATRRGKLRPNSVDSITGENSGNNLGPGTPIIHFEQWENDDEIEVKLILKGGGCENMNAQYSLPAELPNLGRADRIARRRAQVHPARGVERAGQGLRAGRDRRLHRRRPHVRLRAREGAAVPHARRREPGSAAGGARSVDHGRGQQARASARWDSAAASRSSAARSARSIACPRASSSRSPTTAGRIRRLGVVLDARDRRDQALALSRPVEPGRSPMADQAGFQRTGREVALRTPLTEEQVRVAEGRRRRAALGPRVHRPRRRAPSPDDARAAGRSARRRASITAGRWWRRTATAGA